MIDIMEQIGLPALLEQLAEECGELTQACLKYSRLLRGENPTPKTEEQCMRALTEETADVQFCMSVLFKCKVLHYDDVLDVMEIKKNRWHDRIREAGRQQAGGEEE